MITHIAQFTADHKIIQVQQNSIFTWRQESGEIDYDLLEKKIVRESAVHFFKIVAGNTYPIAIEEIEIKILKAVPFVG